MQSDHVIDRLFLVSVGLARYAFPMEEKVVMDNITLLDETSEFPENDCGLE